jgi:hypothetical protein
MAMDESPAPASAEASKQTDRSGLFGIARDLALASIGFVGVLADEVQDLYCRSLERGQEDFRGVHERIRARHPSRRGPDGSETATKAGTTPAGRPKLSVEQWQATLNRLNVASPTDLEALTQQIAELEARIDQLTATE